MECVRAKDEHNAARSVSAVARERAASREQVEESRPVEHAEDSSFDSRAELTRTLDMVDRAIFAAIDFEPAKLAPLIRERRELIAELGADEVVEEVDPFDEFLSGGNVVRIDSTKDRETA